jgi:uncharacterized Zn finger protein (UPF0148 family)
MPRRRPRSFCPWCKVETFPTKDGDCKCPRAKYEPKKEKNRRAAS